MVAPPTSLRRAPGNDSVTLHCDPVIGLRGEIHLLRRILNPSPTAWVTAQMVLMQAITLGLFAVKAPLLVNFFSQIEGEKIYHVYAPAAVSEPELESFYARGVEDIAQLDLESRERSHEHTFALKPGTGLHQPQNAPHWVETTMSRSISYVFVYETQATRARGRVRAFNHYLRSLGLRPAGPGQSPGIDAAKAAAMRVALPIRQRVTRARALISGKAAL